MSLTVHQLLSDAKRLTSRLRDHDTSADGIISSAQDVLKEVEAMRQYQEDIDNLNTIAHNRPRAHLVLGIQQENRHIRQLQHENKELRAALEEHQNVLELIMSKYRQHMICMVNSTKVEKNVLNSEKARILQERADKICEMASVMHQSIQIDEESLAREQEVMARLVTENKGLREMLEISHRNGSYADPLVGPRLVSTGCQTENEVVASVQSNHGAFKDPSIIGGKTTKTTSGSTSTTSNSSTSPRPPREESSLNMNGAMPSSEVSLSPRPLSSASEEESEETSSISEDDEISFNTIKRQVVRRPVCDVFANSAVNNSMTTSPTSSIGDEALSSSVMNNDGDTKQQISNGVMEGEASKEEAAKNEDNNNGGLAAHQDNGDTTTDLHDDKDLVINSSSSKTAKFSNISPATKTANSEAAIESS